MMGLWLRTKVERVYSINTDSLPDLVNDAFFVFRKYRYSSLTQGISDRRDAYILHVLCGGMFKRKDPAR